MNGEGEVGGNEIGIRTAASAGRKALFFVELMRGNQLREAAAREFPQLTGHAVDVRSMLEKTQYLKSFCESFRFDHDERHCRQQIAKIVATVPTDSVEARLRENWRSLQALATRGVGRSPGSSEASEVTPLTAEELNVAFTGFVKEAISWSDRRLEDVITLAGRNLATAIGIFLLVFALFGVEQLRALFFDQPGCSTLALTILLPVPLMWLVGLWVRSRKDRARPVLQHWARTNLFWRATARHPLGYDVFSANSGIGRQLVLAAAFKASAFVLWLVACAAVLLLFSDSRVLQTMGWTVCLLALIGTGLAVLDYWDFLHPAPVRLIFLVAGIGMAVLYASTDFSFVTTFCVVSGAIAYLVYALRKKPAGYRSLIAVVAVVFGIGAGGMALEELTDDTESWRATAGQSAVMIPSPRRAGHDAGAPSSPEPQPAWPHWGPKRRGAAPPVVIVAASGGGSRAAVLTALTLERLAGALVPVQNEHAKSAPGETFADHLHAISSVSGGSLAAAAFLARRVHGEPIEGLSAAVADDFLQPVLIGALSPTVSRGQALENYWVDRLGLDPHLGAIADRWMKGLGTPHPPLPVPLFNSATLDGHAVVVTPLDWTAYASEEETSAARGKSRYFDDRQALGQLATDVPTWVYYRSAIYSLQDLLPGFDPTLAKAVRASANFPFGFPVVQVATDRSLFFSPVPDDLAIGRKERVRLTDGGVVSNSGLWTLSRLLDVHADQLRERGVILVLVDGSKMPEYEGRTRTRDLVNAILDQSLIAGNLHATMLSFMQERLGHRLAVSVVALDPKRENNVYTSWALDQDTRQHIESVAKSSLDSMARDISSAWSTLMNGGRIDSLPPRLPLD
jgi:hypothetical protein